MSLWRRWWFLLLVLILSAIAAFFIPVYWQRRQAAEELRQVLAELDETDPDWRLERIEANRRAVPDDRNGAIVVRAAAEQLPKDWQSNARDEISMVPPPIQLSDDLIKLVRLELDSSRNAVAAARKLAKYPEGRFPTTYSPDWIGTPVEAEAQARRLAALLQVDCFASIQELQLSQAWQSALAALNAGRCMGDGCATTPQLIRVAIASMGVHSVERIMAHGAVTEGELASMQDVLTDEAGHPVFLIVARSERAGCHKLFTYLANEAPSIAVAVEKLGLRKDDRVPRVADHFDDIFTTKAVYRSHAWLLHFHTQVIATGAEREPERDRRLHELNDLLSEVFARAQFKNPDLRYIRPFAYAFIKVSEAEQRVHTLLHCAIAGLAAERFRLKRDRWPQSFHELIQAKLLKEAPEDLCDGKPIRFRRAADGIVFYSVGKDGNAKGDALDHLEHFDPNQVRVEFRLWDPARRRQPPLPPRKLDENPAP
jgi:cell division protein FtsL